ncbi:MAG TPA: decarboxylating 6-phosphogluconate dehydrogenase [Thermoanaerobaculia bacterium]|nr:decarboxylating 6-phosphogluconate dehydrogenase [Thermoanaerobaculia bacterium]
MRLGFVGLGRMGGNMVRRLLADGHEIVAWARSEKSVKEAAAQGAVAATSLEDVAARLTPPRVVWLMIPAGDPVEKSIAGLRPLLSPGDVIVDGGNSRFSDSARRAAELEKDRIGFLDAGTSGGVWGLKYGYCLMVGGLSDHFRVVEPAFKTLAPPDGYAHVGAPGAGHFVKMVHNAIEYAMLQGYGEGLELLQASGYDLDLLQISKLWTHASVVRSWLLDLLVRALEADPKLATVKGFVEDSGEGRWTLHEAIERAVPMPALADSLFARFYSRQPESFSAKVIAALRNQFGGHAVTKE